MINDNEKEPLVASLMLPDYDLDVAWYPDRKCGKAIYMFDDSKLNYSLDLNIYRLEALGDLFPDNLDICNLILTVRDL